ncbi:MAG: C39 family peptidase [Geminicoccaceae bacterium]
MGKEDRSRGFYRHTPKKRSFRKHRLIIASLLAGCALSHPALAIEPPRPVKSLLELRHERVMIQNWDLSCGAAALGTILKYQYDDPVSEREIAKALISRDEYLENPSMVKARLGFSLLDLKRYVDARGYGGIGYGKLELHDLIERAPVIVPISVAGYSHFVVFRGIRGNRILIADPAWGNRTLTLDEFENAWLTYPEFGRVGFVVAHEDETLPPNRLAPRPDDFVFLR